MNPSLALVLSAFLFCCGIAGLLSRRNYIVVLMSIELMFAAASLNFVTFSKVWGDSGGHVFVVFLIAVAAGEVAVGLGILIALFRTRGSANVDDAAGLRG